MICTVLIENTTTDPHLSAQHGFSLFIETGFENLLLDAGQDDAFAENAVVLGKNLTTVDFAVCSHAHYDHAGGFDTFCSLNTVAPVYTYWKKGTEYYSTSHGKPGEQPRFIGFRIGSEHMNRLRFPDRNNPVQVGAGIWLIPVVSHSAATPYKNRTLFASDNGRLKNDTFDHECILAVETEQHGCRGIALFNSCSHNGVINSIESVRHFFPGIQVFSYTGGFHFPWDSGEQIADDDRAGMEALAEYAIRRKILLYTGHCTGGTAFEYLEKICQNRLFRLHTGSVFTV